MSKKAMKLALEALCKMIPCDDVCDCSGQRAITALREALAEQPAQKEPVALKPCWYESKQEKMCRKCGQVHAEAIPPAQQPAQTDWEAVAADQAMTIALLRAEQPAQQELVACAQIVSLNDTQGVVEWLPHNGATLKAGDYLYTPTPAQRKPLTDEEKDAARWRFLVDNSFDKEGITQFHVWEHSWEPHSQTGEPTEWKQRVGGPALDRFIDLAIEAAHGIKGDA